MSKDILRRRAIDLRNKGLSYSEILNEIDVAKSTLSLWLRSVGLSKPQKQRLTEKKLAAIRRGADAKREQRIIKSDAIKKLARSEVSRLIHDPLWLIGTMLYWGEGHKEKEQKNSQVIFSNMDLEMHRMFIRWALKYLNIDKNRLRYEVYLHRNYDVNKIKSFWSNNLNISIENIRVYFKPINSNSVRKNIGENYNGVLRVWITKSTDLNRKIAGWTKGVIEQYNK